MVIPKCIIILRCSRVLRPLCGNDGQDYNNECMAGCAGAVRTTHLLEYWFDMLGNM